VLGAALALKADDAADKAAFEKVCGHCHAASLIHELKTQGEWVETVDNMAANGAKGTDEEFDAVLRYLSRNFTKVNINVAPAAEIAPVLDIGETAAQAIVDYRTAHGEFASLDDVKKVPGIDTAKVDARKDRIAFR
jgi:competence protein ComEA